MTEIDMTKTYDVKTTTGPLSNAIRCNHHDVVSYLLEQGERVAKQSQMSSAFIECGGQGYIDMIRRFTSVEAVELSMPREEKDGCSITPLRILQEALNGAVWEKNLEMMNTLAKEIKIVDKDADMEECCHAVGINLDLAFTTGSLEVFDGVVKWIGKTAYSSSKAWGWRHFVVVQGEVELADRIHEMYPLNSSRLWYAMSDAIEGGHIPLARWARAKINLNDDEMAILFNQALKGHRLQSVQYIHQECGYSLQDAERYLNREMSPAIFEYLVVNGPPGHNLQLYVKLDSRPVDGWRCFVERYQGHISNLQQLVMMHLDLADFTKLNNKPHTNSIIHASITLGKLDHFKWMLANRPNSEVMNGVAQDLLAVAVAQGQLDVARYLVENEPVNLDLHLIKSSFFSHSLSLIQYLVQRAPKLFKEFLECSEFVKEVLLNLVGTGRSLIVKFLLQSCINPPSPTLLSTLVFKTITPGYLSTYIVISEQGGDSNNTRFIDIKYMDVPSTSIDGYIHNQPIKSA
eukprot:gene5979-6933_t